ncbi:MAG TPA: hypothetical protein VFX96_02805 [Pyrinomonadaceae bacterium]|nr:hypothetical protein [Pyrinomonadaceae bacterium]
MKTTTQNEGAAARRRGERGAAMLTAMLTSMLLLVGGGALLVTTTMSATNAIDSTAETQAYYAAESGIQASLDVLRGNIQPNPLPAAAGSALNAISFRRALYRRTPGDTSVPSSNRPDDPANDARLSRWLNYNANFPDRVTLSPNYNPFTGTAYSVTVTDPDQSDQIRFSSVGRFISTAALPAGVTISADGSQLVIVDAGKTVTLTYVPRAATNVTAYPPVASDLGTVTVSAAGAGVTDLNAVFGGSMPRLRITLDQTDPWTSSAILEGQLSGTVTVTAGGAVTPALSVAFPNPPQLTTTGATYTMPNAALNLNALSNTVQCTVAAQDPRRLYVRAVGFGPRGARKVMRVLLNRSFFDFTPNATVMLGSAEDGTPSNVSIGQSNAKTYTGNDLGNPPQPPLPVFGTTSDGDDTATTTNIDGSKPNTVTSASEKVAKIDNNNLPSFLQSADQARALLTTLETTARSTGRYFTSSPSTFGTTDEPAFTFVDGDCDLSGGAGLLVVTGELSLSGNVSFEGIILVLGEGVMTRSGGGNGDILGSIVVAKFARTWPASENGQPHPFLAPTFDTSGGGASTVGYSSTAVNRALNVLGFRTMGFAEL